MKIEVLGCHGSETLTSRAAGFLIDDQVLLEAGTASSMLSLERQGKIHSVIISHLHMDHLKDLPFLVDNLIRGERHGISVYGIPEILDGLREHLFNDKLWPDSTRFVKEGGSLLRFHALVPEKEMLLGEIGVTPYLVCHNGPAIGLLVRKEDRIFLYSGDTAPTDRIWEAAKKLPGLSGVMIEASFPNQMGKIAAASAHLTPSLVLGELQKLDRPEVPVYIFHMKPRYERTIVGQLEQILGDRVHVLQEGEIIHL